MVKNVRALRDKLKEAGIEVPVGIQTIGKKDVFGSLAEVAEVCKRVHGVIPVLDISHIHARGSGQLREKKDFQQVFDTVQDIGLDWYLLELTGVTYNKEGEIYHVPFRKGDMSVIKLMECIIENGFHVTIISESPILEHDAVYAQILLDRAMEITK
jgi:deoxyribonuclease-4